MIWMVGLGGFASSFLRLIDWFRFCAWLLRWWVVLSVGSFALCIYLAQFRSLEYSVFSYIVFPTGRTLWFVYNNVMYP